MSAKILSLVAALLATVSCCMSAKLAVEIKTLREWRADVLERDAKAHEAASLGGVLLIGPVGSTQGCAGAVRLLGGVGGSSDAVGRIELR